MSCIRKEDNGALQGNGKTEPIRIYTESVPRGDLVYWDRRYGWSTTYFDRPIYVSDEAWEVHHELRT